MRRPALRWMRCAACLLAAILGPSAVAWGRPAKVALPGRLAGDTTHAQTTLGTDGVHSAQVERRRLRTALEASLAGTLVPIAVGVPMCRGGAGTGTQSAGFALIAAGLVGGPSLGYYVKGDARRANREILTHLVIGGVTAGGVALTLDRVSNAPLLFALFGTWYLLAHIATDITEVRHPPRARLGLVPIGDERLGAAVSLQLRI